VGGEQVIVLDTHIWIWWVDGDERLSDNHMDLIETDENGTIGVSAISCWETAKLVELGRLELTIPVDEWLEGALSYPGVALVPLSPRIAVDSTQLPGTFHRDPADQIIVATARSHECRLLTADERIRNYPHVETV
jgi:PIN domain nuclease of toxin-antitoxin system